MGNCLEKLKRGQRGEGDNNDGKSSLERKNRYQEADDDS